MTTLRQLRYLEAITRHSHFGKAAAECSVSQPEMCIREQVPDSRIRLLRFADPQPSRTVAMAWRKSTPLRDDYMALSQLMLDGWDA